MSKEDDTTDKSPSIRDRVDASDDFGAALDQSVGLVTANKKLLLLLVVASFILVLWLAYPYLVGIVG